MIGEIGKTIQRVLRLLDRFQQRHTPTAFVYGVVKKYGEDRGGQLSGLIAYYGFLSFFPLMLVLITVTAFLARQHPHLAEQIRDSALKQFPVVGPDLAGHERALPGSGLGLAIGLAGLVWGALGVTHAIQFAFAEIWDVPQRERPNFFIRLVRGLAFFALLGVAVVAIVGLSSIGGLVHNSLVAGAFGLVSATVLSIATFLLVFKILSPERLGWLDLLPGAVVAGLGYQVLQTLGVQLVQRQLQHASQLYGTVGVVLGLIFFLVLVSQITLYALELDAVLDGRFWPRSLFEDAPTPSGDVG